MSVQMPSISTICMFSVRLGAASSTNLAKVSNFTMAKLHPCHRMPQLGPNGEVFLVIENLFDSDYTYRPDYPMPGTPAQIGVRMGF